MKMVKIEKNGTDITITLDDNRTIVFYGNEGTLISYTGRMINSLPPVKRLENPTDREKALLNCLIHDASNHARLANEYVSHLRRFELFYDWIEQNNWYFNPNVLPPQCPKGFLKWVKENNYCLDRSSYEKFLMERQLLTLTQEDRDFITLIKEHVSVNQQTFDWYVNTTPENRIKIRQIFKATTKTLSWNLSNEVYNFVSYFWTNEYYDYYSDACLSNPMNYADSNRTIEYNLKQLKEICSTLKGNFLKMRQERIKAIEEIENDNFVIVVPTLDEHFTNEGQQQHNCVGHFYHRSIKENKNLIYFIRKKSNPKKSYITNRYNIQSKKTVESRKINNTANNDNDAWNLIDQIDKKITELLTKQS